MFGASSSTNFAREKQAGAHSYAVRYMAPDRGRKGGVSLGLDDVVFANQPAFGKAGVVELGDVERVGVAVEDDFAEQEAGSRSVHETCLLYTSPSPRDRTRSRMPSSA